MLAQMKTCLLGQTMNYLCSFFILFSGYHSQSDAMEEPFFGSLEKFQSRVGVKNILKNVVCNGKGQ